MDVPRASRSRSVPRLAITDPTSAAPHAHVYIPRVVRPHVRQPHGPLEPEGLPPAHTLQRERERVVHQLPRGRVRPRQRRRVLERRGVLAWETRRERDPVELEVGVREGEGAAVQETVGVGGGGAFARARGGRGEG